MLTVAYLANRFPSAVEPYVNEEILELRRREVHVIAGSVRRAKAIETETTCSPEIVLQPLRVGLMLHAAWLGITRWRRIVPLLMRIFFRGKETLAQRAKALAHTGLGAYYAAALQGRDIEHIHVHHGYFGSWIGMVAAKLLGVGFSLTFHGSDLLLHAQYLDVKIGACGFCLTVSEFNRRYILEHFPEIDHDKVVVSRLGVEVDARFRVPPSCVAKDHNSALHLLAVGRLHAVKNHAFLVKGCAALRARGVSVRCLIAGDGPERRKLESLIHKLGLGGQVTLLGHVPRERMNSLYDQADVVALTSCSEGLPLVLMEAMARGRIVVAPEITGIPELVIDGKTGCLYKAGSEESFVSRLLFVRSLMMHAPTETQASHESEGPPTDPRLPLHPPAAQLDWIRHAARGQILHNYYRARNLESFGDLFIQRIAPQTASFPREDFVLQQI